MLYLGMMTTNHNLVSSAPGISAFLLLIVACILTLSETPTSAQEVSADKSSAATSLTQQEFKDAVAHYNKAVEWHQAGHYNKAIAEYRAAIAIDDRMFQAWSNLAGVYMMNRSFSKAIDCFEKDVSINPKPNRSEEWSGYATALWSVGRKVEAIEKCRHALELNPSDSYAARNLAFMLKDAGRSEEAQKVLEKASRFTKDGGEILEPLEPRY